jgi:hypothetical protein
MTPATRDLSAIDFRQSVSPYGGTLVKSFSYMGFMRKTLALGGPELLTVIGACLFIFILAFSAYFEADIRWLHFFQAWMYIVTIALCLQRNRWGYFIGISAAGFWDYINLCVTTFFPNGLHWLRASLATGQIQHMDQIIAVPAWIGNLLVIVGCVWAYRRLSDKNLRDWVRFVFAFILTTAFFAADIFIFQPRYLPLFRESLHPHSPFALVSISVSSEMGDGLGRVKEVAPGSSLGNLRGRKHFESQHGSGT